MPGAVIVIGAVEGVRRDLERRLGCRARLLVIKLVRDVAGAYRLEPRHPQSAVQMVEAAADSATSYAEVQVVVLPYATCPKELKEIVAALEGLGSTVIQPQPRSGKWPSRPPALDHRFQTELRDALLGAIDDWYPGEIPPEEIRDAIERARIDFGSTLIFCQEIAINSSLDGEFWYRVFRALHELCENERCGKAINKREMLRDLLTSHIGSPKQTYKVADTGTYAINPATGKKIELRERVHIREGRPAETESIYWITLGNDQANFKYLIGRIGRHA